MKKNFEQPALEVVRMNNRDIVTESLGITGTVTNPNAILAPGQRSFDEWYEGY